MNQPGLSVREVQDFQQDLKVQRVQLVRLALPVLMAPVGRPDLAAQYRRRTPYRQLVLALLMVPGCR